MPAIEMIRIMSWRRRCMSLFPYGYIFWHIVRSSISPFIFTLLLIEGPTLALAIDIIVRSLLSHFFSAIILSLSILNIVSLFLCVYTNPGILPQNVNNYEWDQQLLELPSVNHITKNEHSYLTVGQYGLSFYTKYCVECHIYRPLRTIHCRSCNHCVEMYDHHCQWLGICIGKRNYQYFLIFVGMVNLLMMALLGCSLAIVIDSIRKQKNILEYLFEVIVALLALGFGLGLVKLFVYHIGLGISRLTTNEDLKRTYSSIGQKVPFQRCQKNPSPWFHLQDKLVRIEPLEMESNRFSITKGKRYSTLVSDRQSVLNQLVEQHL